MRLASASACSRLVSSSINAVGLPLSLNSLIASTGANAESASRMPSSLTSSGRFPIKIRIEPLYTRCSSHDMHAAIDVHSTAGNAPRIGGGEVGTRETDIHDIDQFAHRRLLHRLVQQKIEVLEPRSRARLERPRRYRMDPDAPRAELIGEIAAGGFQRSLDWPHDIVVRDHALRAVVAHGEHSTAIFHQRRCELRHANEGVAGDVDRAAESLRGTV